MKAKPKPSPVPSPASLGPLRAAIYARVSTRDKGQTTENQIPVLRAFALEQHWDPILVYEDRDHGDKANREQFQAMLAAAKLRQFDVLVFWSLDRFSREGSFATLDHLQRLSGWGVRFRSYTEQYLDTCGIFRDAIIALLAALAKQEQIRLSERVRAGLARAKAQGRIGGRRLTIDLDRFRRMDAIYTRQELMHHLKIGRSTVWELRKRAKEALLAQQTKADAQDPTQPQEPQVSQNSPPSVP